MSIISAGTTITTALVQTGDLTGELVLKTNTSNTAVTINGVGAIGFGSTPDYGTAGQFMRSGGVAGVPSWQTVDANQWISNSTSIYYNSGNVGIGTSSPNFSGYGSTNLTISGGTTIQGVLELVGTRTDGSGNAAGDVNFFADSNSSGNKRIASIQAQTDGATANNRGGAVVINTKSNNGALAERMRIDSSGMVLPGANNTYDLGSTSLRWRNIYTNDLHLSNGIGDYTVVEGEEDLFLYNNKSGKTFKFALIEVDPSEAPPKAKAE